MNEKYRTVDQRERGRGFKGSRAQVAEGSESESDEGENWTLRTGAGSYRVYCHFERRRSMPESKNPLRKQRPFPCRNGSGITFGRDFSTPGLRPSGRNDEVVGLGGPPRFTFCALAFDF